jgi:hypothetical protein
MPKIALRGRGEISAYARALGARGLTAVGVRIPPPASPMVYANDGLRFCSTALALVFAVLVVVHLALRFALDQRVPMSAR